MLIRPVHRERASVHEHNNNWLAARNKVLQKISLGFGKIKAGAVAARKSFDVDRHLFAFKFAGEPEHRDDRVGFAHRIGIVLLISRLVPHQPCKPRASLLRTLDLDRIRMSRLEMNRLEARLTCIAVL